MKRYLALFLLSILSISYTLAQCPACKTALESNREDGTSNIGNGINDGILYLLAMPYLLFVVVGFVLYRNYKKRKAGKLEY